MEVPTQATYENIEDICDLIGKEVIDRTDGHTVKIIGVLDSNTASKLQYIDKQTGCLYSALISTFKLFGEFSEDIEEE